MSKRVILPTAEIIRRYFFYDELFCYSSGDLREFVRDTVLYHDAYRAEMKEYYMDFPRSFPAARAIQAWRDSPDGTAERHLFGRTSREDALSAITTLIDDDVGAMLRAVFAWPSDWYSIDHRSPVWIGDDLVVVADKYFGHPDLQGTFRVPRIHNSRHGARIPAFC